MLCEDREGTIEYARKLVAAGASVITVHGRNRDEKKQQIGDPDWDMIRRIKAAVGIPLIANGGIALPEDIEKCLTVTNADAVMSSEMSLCRPDVFRAIGSPRISVDSMVERYNQLVAKYAEVVHAPHKPYRAHLFKLLFQGLQMHPDLRSRLSEASNCAEMKAASEELAARGWEQKLLEKDPQSWLTGSWYWRYRDGKLDVKALLSNDESASSSSISSSAFSSCKGRSVEKQRELMPTVLEEVQNACEALREAEESGANNKKRNILKRRLVKAEKRKRKAIRKLATLENRAVESFETATTSPGLVSNDEEGESRQRRVVIFDCDGTLTDSLRPHIEFCHSLKAKFNLDIYLPDPTDLDGSRLIAAAPMRKFIEKAGFPKELITKCVSEYESSFSQQFKVLPFPDVPEFLRRLNERGFRLAVVSSNTSANVLAALGDELPGLFETIIGIDNGPASKKDSIRLAMKMMSVDVKGTQVLYIGDTKKDAECALDAGCQFIGVNYGFEDLQASLDVSKFPVALTVGSLEETLLGSKTLAE